ncbi:MAG: CPBP family intramembrane glutamic endopeptidase [Planctomycetota bacterium]|jgi:membrane protease YdiL (CAAX protease family)
MLGSKGKKVFQTALNEKRRLRYTTAVVLCFSLVAPFSLSVIAPWLIAFVGRTAYPIIIEICFWAMAFVVLAVVLFWERQSLRSIGFRRLTWKEGLIALSLSIFLFVLVPTLAIFMERVIRISTGTMDIVKALAQIPLWLHILLALRAGFVEEVLYRGYPIERLNRLTGRIWPGAVICIIIHTVIHLPMGLWNTVGVVFPITVILTGLYVWKRNLTLNITVHFLGDLLVLVLLPQLPFLS